MAGIMDALAALAGGVQGYAGEEDRQRKEQLTRAMDQLKLEQAKRSMGLVAYDPNNQDDRLKSLDLGPNKLRASVGVTPSTTDKAMGALTAGPQTTAPQASITEGRTQQGGAGDPGRFGEPIQLEDPSTGRTRSYRSDESQSDTGRLMRREDAKQAAEYGRQDRLLQTRQALDKDKLRQANRGYFDVLNQAHKSGNYDAFPDHADFSKYQDSEGLRASFDDYMARMKDRTSMDREDARTSRMFGGIGAMNRQDRLDAQDAEGLAYLNDPQRTRNLEPSTVGGEPTTADAGFGAQFQALRKAHPDWTPGRISYAIKGNATTRGKMGAVEAGAEGKKIQNQFMSGAAGGGAVPSGKAGPVGQSSVPPGADPQKYLNDLVYKKWVDQKLGIQP